MPTPRRAAARPGRAPRCDSESRRPTQARLFRVLPATFAATPDPPACSSAPAAARTLRGSCCCFRRSLPPAVAQSPWTLLRLEPQALGGSLDLENLLPVPAASIFLSANPGEGARLLSPRY